MKPGELRKFDDMSDSGNYDSRRVSDKIFMVISEGMESEQDVGILLDGVLESGWGYDWVNIHSEVICETW